MDVPAGVILQKEEIRNTISNLYKGKKMQKNPTTVVVLYSAFFQQKC